MRGSNEAPLPDGALCSHGFDQPDGDQSSFDADIRLTLTNSLIAGCRLVTTEDDNRRPSRFMITAARAVPVLQLRL